MDLNQYQSTFINTPGLYDVRIVEAKNDYTRGGRECVAVRFETDNNQTISCVYVESVYWRLFRLAQAAGLSQQQRAAFEPKMLIGKNVKINVVADGQNRVNVSEVFAADSAPAKTATDNDMPF